MEVPPGLLDGLGTVGVVVLVGWLVMSGRLVPRRTYDDKVKEVDEWRAESRIKDQQLAEKDKQLALMSEVGASVNAVMGAIQQGANRGRGVGT